MVCIPSLALCLLILCCQLLNSKASQAMMPNDEPAPTEDHRDEMENYQNVYGDKKGEGKWNHGLEDWSVKNYQNGEHGSGHGGLVDDEDHWEYSASGSGDGIKPHPSYKQRSGNQGTKDEDDITFDPPYVAATDLHGNAPKHLSFIVISMTTILSLFVWING